MSADEQRCESFDDDVLAVALGTASGRRRDEVLDHLEHCPSCRADLVRFSLVADTLLELAPEVEPPLGFETRLAERWRSVRPSSGSTRRRLAGVLVLAAVVVAMLGVGLGVLLANRTGPAPERVALGPPAEASLRSNGRVVGDVILTTDSTPWMIMTIDKVWWSGTVTCEAVLASGRVETVGTFRLADDYSTWGAPLTAAIGEVRGARLIAANGVVLASARIRG